MRRLGLRQCAIVALALALALVAPACGISPDKRATELDDDDVPFGLLDPLQPSPVVGVPEAGSGVTDIYLVGTAPGSMLVAAPRSVPALTIDDALEALTAGPSDVEATRGVRSALPGPEVIRSAEVSGGVASIDLDESFTHMSGSEQLLAFAQLVYTATELPGVGRVTFTLEGAPLAVPRANGSLTNGSISRDAYRQFGG